MKKITILSTVKISEAYCELFAKNNIELVQHNFIKTSPVNFKLPKHGGGWIFTSKNAVEAVYLSKEKEKCDGMQHFCVGENTKSILIKNGQKVLKMSNNSIKLANFLKKMNKNENYIFCRGSIKNKDFTKFFQIHAMNLIEIPVYKTKLAPLKIDLTFDGIMFFSPSAIKSFIKKNQIQNSECFCIGETTSNFAKKFSDKTHFSLIPSVENVINQTINFFKND